MFKKFNWILTYIIICSTVIASESHRNNLPEISEKSQGGNRNELYEIDDSYKSSVYNGEQKNVFDFHQIANNSLIQVRNTSEQNNIASLINNLK